jgi:hypothetical protein
VTFRGGFVVEAGGNDGLAQSNTAYSEQYLAYFAGLWVNSAICLADRVSDDRCPLTLASAIVALNLMTGIIDGFRWSILRGNPPLDMQALALSVAISGATSPRSSQ